MKAILPGATIGVLGSGQLGRMFAIAARRMGYRVHTYSPDKDTPTGQVGRRRVHRHRITISIAFASLPGMSLLLRSNSRTCPRKLPPPRPSILTSAPAVQFCTLHKTGFARRPSWRRRAFPSRHLRRSTAMTR